MATRSRIGIRNTNGSITSIYCHWDGSPETRLPILMNHYRTAKAVRALLSLGDLSSLRPELGRKHPFMDRSHPQWCTTYRRDRGDVDVATLIHSDETALANAACECSAEFVYLFCGNAWSYSRIYSSGLPFHWCVQELSESQAI